MTNSRARYYEKLTGKGLEIGALHEPAVLPDTCKVEYFDLRSREESIRLFHEVEASRIVDVAYVGDIDKRELRNLGPERFDFVIANHVIEHLANPIAFVEDVFWLVKPKGVVVISAPDKRYTFDRERELTSFGHLVQDYRADCIEASDEHYLEFISKVLPEGKGLVGDDLQRLLNLVRLRREHVHVWDSDSFKSFMINAFQILNVEAKLLSEATGDETGLEYLGVWEKSPPKWWRRFLAVFHGRSGQIGRKRVASGSQRARELHPMRGRAWLSSRCWRAGCIWWLLLRRRLSCSRGSWSGWTEAAAARIRKRSPFAVAMPLRWGGLRLHLRADRNSMGPGGLRRPLVPAFCSDGNRRLASE